MSLMRNELRISRISGQADMRDFFGSHYAMTLPMRLKQARKARFSAARDAAQAMGIPPSTYYGHENGSRAPEPGDVARYAKFFGVAAAWLLYGDADTAADPPLHAPVLEDALGRPDLPVYAAVEGGPGEMVISTDPIEWVTRPWYLKAVRDGYAVLIVGESMAPVFEPGDYAIVNPRLPPMAGQDAIFTQERSDGEFKATIKRLVRRGPSIWRVRQFNPPEGQESEFDLRSPPWTKAVRVVGKYYRG